MFFIEYIIILYMNLHEHENAFTYSRMYNDTRNAGGMHAVRAGGSAPLADPLTRYVRRSCSHSRSAVLCV